MTSSSTSPLTGRRIAFLVANEGIEQIELTAPWQAVLDAGGQPELLAPEAGTAQAFHHLDRADRFPVDRTTSDARVEDYDAAVLPGFISGHHHTGAVSHIQQDVADDVLEPWLLELRRMRAPRRNAPFVVASMSLYVCPTGIGPTMVKLEKIALVTGQTPAVPVASLSLSKPSEVEAPEGAFQVWSKYSSERTPKPN